MKIQLKFITFGFSGLTAFGLHRLNRPGTCGLFVALILKQLFSQVPATATAVTTTSAASATPATLTLHPGSNSL